MLQLLNDWKVLIGCLPINVYTWILLKQESEWRWHQLGHMQVCTSLQTDNNTSTQFSQAGCPSCRTTNSVKALKPHAQQWAIYIKTSSIEHLPYFTFAENNRGMSSQKLIFWYTFNVICCFSDDTSTYSHGYTHTRLTALFRVYPGEPVPER